MGSEEMLHLISENVSEIKTKVNEIERDMRGYLIDMSEMKTNFKNIEKSFCDHKIEQERDFKDLKEYSSLIKKNAFTAIEAVKDFTIPDVFNNVRKETIRDIKLWIYGAFFAAISSIALSLVLYTIKNVKK